MTIPGLGRAMPVHIWMVHLAGIQLGAPFSGRQPSSFRDDAKMADTMREGHEQLRDWCGVDFGMDLAAWRAYLLSPEAADRGYRHPYAFATVDRLVVAAIDDPRRKRIAELL